MHNQQDEIKSIHKKSEVSFVAKIEKTLIRSQPKNLTMPNFFKNKETSLKTKKERKRKKEKRLHT